MATAQRLCDGEHRMEVCGYGFVRDDTNIYKELRVCIDCGYSEWVEIDAFPPNLHLYDEIGTKPQSSDTGCGMPLIEIVEKDFELVGMELYELEQKVEKLRRLHDGLSLYLLRLRNKQGESDERKSVA